MRDLINITKALADESRVRIVMFLQGGELCVCQIIDMFGLAPSTVSKHMAILVQAGLVQCRKSGKWHYYSLPGEDAPALVQNTLRWLQNALAKSSQVGEDKKRLKSVMKKDMTELCVHYK